jgi:hypothetical protein
LINGAFSARTDPAGAPTGFCGFAVSQRKMNLRRKLMHGVQRIPMRSLRKLSAVAN